MKRRVVVFVCLLAGAVGLSGPLAWAGPEDPPPAPWRALDPSTLPPPPAGDAVRAASLHRPERWAAMPDEPSPMPPPPPPPPPPPAPPGGVAPAAAAGQPVPTPGGLPTWPDYLKSRVRKPSDLHREAATPQPDEICGGVPCYARPCGPRAPGQGRQWDPMLRNDRFKPYLNAYLGGSLSFLPNVGLALQYGAILRRDTCLKLAWEVEATVQFVDDEFFADDGNPTADPWFQVQAGLKVATAPNARRHWTFRAGPAWFYAGENPNIVNEEGHYFGVYAGVGFEADLTEGFTTGPELSAMLVVHEHGDVVVVPQFNWHFVWNF